MTDIHCSPNRHQHGTKHGTCFKRSELDLIVKTFNNKNPNNPINPKLKKKDIAKILLEEYRKVCNKSQFCWISKLLDDSEHKKSLMKAFRPEMPSSWKEDPKTWLNTYDILYVLKQYEELYKDFEFLGVYSIDFFMKNSSNNCIGNDFGNNMCELNIKDLLKKGKKQFGVVFNTDTSNGSGEHWFAMYCNFGNSKKHNYGIYYYDSVASIPDKEYIIPFVKNIQNTLNLIPFLFQCKFKVSLLFVTLN
jgi:hypothetical protein